VFIPAGAHPARIARIRGEGARVELVRGRYDDAVRACAAQSAEHGWQVVSDTGYPGYLEVPAWIAEGYLTAFEEAARQREDAGAPAPSCVLIQAGVGGLLHAAVTHFRSRPDGPLLVAVEPESADALICSIESPGGMPTPASGRQDSVMAGLNCGEVSLAAWPSIRAGVDLFVTVSDALAEQAVGLLATPAGADPAVALSPTGAAGLAGLLALSASGAGRAGLGSESRVLVVGTEQRVES